MSGPDAGSIGVLVGADAAYEYATFEARHDEPVTPDPFRADPSGPGASAIHTPEPVPADRARMADRQAGSSCAVHLTGMSQTRVPAGIPTGGRFAATGRAEAALALPDATAEAQTEDPWPGRDFPRQWPALRHGDGRRGTVRTTNGGEISGVLSSYGTTYAVDVETDDGRWVGISGWRVAGVRLDDDPSPPDFSGEGGIATADEIMTALSPTDGLDWDSLRDEYEDEHPVVMAALRDDLVRNGMRTPVVVRDGKVENGQHRVLASADTGTAVRWAAWTGQEPKVYWDPETREHYGPDEDEDDEGQLRY